MKELTCTQFQFLHLAGAIAKDGYTPAKLPVHNNFNTHPKPAPIGGTVPVNQGSQPGSDNTEHDKPDNTFTPVNVKAIYDELLKLFNIVQ